MNTTPLFKDLSDAALVENYLATKALAYPRASWFIRTGFPNGWCVTVTVGSETLSRFYGRTGGEWELDDGVLGRQLEGTCDLRAPHNPERFDRWVRRHLAESVSHMKSVAHST